MDIVVCFEGSDGLESDGISTNGQGDSSTCKNPGKSLLPVSIINGEPFKQLIRRLTVSPFWLNSLIATSRQLYVVEGLRYSNQHVLKTRKMMTVSHL